MAFDSERAIREARRDDAGTYDCARGVANILIDQGLPCTRGHAHTWAQTLPENGWILIEGLSPDTAPEGAVVVYDRNDNHATLMAQGVEDGRVYGHVEVVTVSEDGTRNYAAGAAIDSTPGGSVPQNFVGVYVNPANMTPQQILALQQQGVAENYTALAATNRRATDNASMANSFASSIDGLLGTDLAGAIQSLTAIFTAVATAVTSGSFNMGDLAAAFQSVAGPDNSTPVAPTHTNTPTFT